MAIGIARPVLALPVFLVTRLGQDRGASRADTGKVRVDIGYMHDKARTLGAGRCCIQAMRRRHAMKPYSLIRLGVHNLARPVGLERHARRRCPEL